MGSQGDGPARNWGEAKARVCWSPVTIRNLERASCPVSPGSRPSAGMICEAGVWQVTPGFSLPGLGLLAQLGQCGLWGPCRPALLHVASPAHWTQARQPSYVATKGSKSWRPSQPDRSAWPRGPSLRSLEASAHCRAVASPPRFRGRSRPELCLQVHGRSRAARTWGV